METGKLPRKLWLRDPEVEGGRRQLADLPGLPRDNGTHLMREAPTQQKPK